MGITKITLDELPEMTETNGFILQNCAGDPQEWVDAINEALTEKGVLKNGEAFINVPMLTNDGSNNLLFFMDGLRVSTADITAWVHETRSTVEGMMLNDYREKMFGIPVPATKQRSKPECPIIGADGNIFSLVGIASRTLKRAGQHDAAAEMWDRVQDCSGYDAALAVLMDYVAPVGAELDWEL